jgi:hypothetical protein
MWWRNYDQSHIDVSEAPVDSDLKPARKDGTPVDPAILQSSITHCIKQNFDCRFPIATYSSSYYRL